MAPLSPQLLAELLEHIVELNSDEPCVIEPPDYDVPIIELGIGSLDLIEWAFALEDRYQLDIEIDALEGLSSFTITDAYRWIAAGVEGGAREEATV